LLLLLYLITDFLSPHASLLPMVLRITQASSFRLWHFPYYVRCPYYSCFCREPVASFPGIVDRCIFSLSVAIL